MTTTFTWTTPTGEDVPLDGSAGVSAVLPVLGLDAPPLTWGLEDRVAFDGAVAFRVRAEERPISLPLLIDVNDMSMREVARLFAPIVGAAGLVTVGGTLTATTDGLDRTLENVIYEGGLEGEYSGEAGTEGLPWRLVTVRLLALDPYWLGPVESEALNIGAVTAFDAAVAFDDASIPFDGGDSTLVSVPGDSVSFPMFIVDGPFTTLVLDGPDTGETVELAGALAAGDQIVIDSNPGNRGPRLNGGDVDWMLLTRASRLFPLSNPSATVSISATGTTGASSVEMRWRNRYLMP